MKAQRSCNPLRDRALARGGWPVDGDHRRCNAREGVEIVWEGLGDTARIVDPHRHAAQSGQREAHRDAMVVIGIDGGMRLQTRRPTGTSFSRWRDGYPVLPLLDRCPQLAQFGRHGHDAIGFLDAPRGDIPQGALTIGEQRGDRQRHRRIGDVIQIEIEGPQLAAFRRTRLDPVVASHDARTHRFQRGGKLDVALNALLANPLDAYRTARNGAGGEKVRGRRGIAFDMHQTGTTIALSGRDRETLPTLPLNRHAEARHQIQGDLDVGLGDQLGGQLDDRSFSQLMANERQRHQQGGQELRGNIPPHSNRPAQGDFGRRQFERRIALLAGVTDSAADLTQTIDQIADRPLMHARHTADFVMPPGQCQGRRQRSDRRASIAHEQIALLDRKHPAHTAHAPGIRPQRVQPDAQGSQCVEHHARVVGIEQVADFRRTRGHGREQQHAVGDALRAGQLDGTRNVRQRRDEL